MSNVHLFWFLLWFILWVFCTDMVCFRYIYLWNLQFLNNTIINETKICVVSCVLVIYYIVSLLIWVLVVHLTRKRFIVIFLSNIMFCTRIDVQRWRQIILKVYFYYSLAFMRNQSVKICRYFCPFKCDMNHYSRLPKKTYDTWELPWHK